MGEQGGGEGRSRALGQVDGARREPAPHADTHSRACERRRIDLEGLERNRGTRTEDRAESGAARRRIDTQTQRNVRCDGGVGRVTWTA